MNTHDKLELPPLPKASKMYDIPGYDEEELKDYARAAIEADRRRRGEPVGYIMPTALKQLKAGGNAIVGGVSQGGDVAVYLAPQPAEPVKSSLKVSYDAHGDVLYVDCDSNEPEPIDAEEDDKGILYRRAISDGRLIGITVMNFMGQPRYGKGTP